MEGLLEGKYNGHPTSLEYLARPDGSAVLTFVAQIQNEAENTWYEAFIDAHSGDLVSVIDFTAEAAVSFFFRLERVVFVSEWCLS